MTSAFLAPIAVLGAWVQAEFIETESFVETLKPLATHPEIQEVVTDQVTDAIVTEFLQLSPIASALVNPIVRGQVEIFVESPQFAQIWETSLREIHARTIRLLEGDPNAALQLDDEGLVSLNLGPIVAGVKGDLVAQGIVLANLIPEVDRSVVIISSESFLTLRTVFRVVEFVNYWLSFVVIGLVAVGVVVATSHLRAIAWTGLGWAVGMGVLGGALIIARDNLTERRSELFSDETIVLMFDELTAGLVEIIRWSVILGLVIAVASALTVWWRQSRSVTQ